ncbi:MAG: phosphate/phosphite/phosphonate ABC transporter substrate-binding protein [Gallionella sp.]|nr:phosphate/phosphite/phosphonate ABC transporter substrate-binding protein [Gallionella sp.]
MYYQLGLDRAAFDFEMNMYPINEDISPPIIFMETDDYGHERITRSRVREKSFFKSIFVMILACMMSMAVLAESLDNKSSSTLIFGVLNQQSAIQTAERWNPILRYLTQKTGIPMQLKMGATVELTDAMMGREEFDLVFTNHSFQKEFDGKYRVLVRWEGKPIYGMLVVRDESQIRSLSDLQGQTVAFPSEDAFVAYAVPVGALKKAGIEVTPLFAGNQDGVLAQLKAKQVTAAAVNSRFLETYATSKTLRYRVIYQSEPFHELPILIHPRVSAEMAAALRQALLAMGADPEAVSLWKEGKCQGFEPAGERDYDNVRRLYRGMGK